MAHTTVQYNSSGLSPIRMDLPDTDGSLAQIIELCGPGPKFTVVSVAPVNTGNNDNAVFISDPDRGELLELMRRLTETVERLAEFFFDKD